MPTYELHCQACDATFELKESIAVHEQHQRKHDVQCPDCASTAVEPQLSVVEVKTSKKS